jgi:hypothetical protein
MHQYFGALQVPEKSIPKALASMRAFDQSGNVGDDEAS